MIFWSSGFVGAELGARQSVAAPTLLTWRFLLGTVLLAALWLVLRPRTDHREVWRQAVLGTLTQVGYLLPVYLGIQHGVRGGTVSLVAALQPLLVAVLAGPLLGERTSGRQRMGLLLGFAGVVVVVSGDLSAGAPAWWAYLPPLLGVLSLSGGTLLGRRWRARSFLVSLTVQTGVGAVLMVIFSAATGQLTPPAGAGFVVAVGWVAVLSGLGGYGAYLLVLRTQGATAVSTWLYLTPPVTMLWTWLMFGDRIGLAGLIGLVVTGAGVALALRAGRAGKQTDRPTPSPHHERHDTRSISGSH